MTSSNAIEAIWRMESAKLIAALTRMVRDISLAEDLAQDALVIALEQWPIRGTPDNPGAWLMTTAKRRAIDLIRKNKLRDRKYEEFGRNNDLYSVIDYELESTVDGEISDDLLRLIFTTCHPILSREARIALTLRLLGGLSTDEIAHAFLVTESTIAQRIVRAKRTLREAQVPFEMPEGNELEERLLTVLEVIYLMYNEGYMATSGGNLMRPLLCQEALRLGRILAEIMSHEPEVHGLVALMEIQSSRFNTRVNSRGEPILLMDQNRTLWDHLLIQRGLSSLEKARNLGHPLGPYTLQAAISACHAEARTASETDWVRIAALYEALARISPSPVIELNRAMSIAMAFGPAFGLQLVDEFKSDPSLKDYHLLPSVRGDLLVKLGRLDEAHEEFMRASALTNNARERDLLLKRANECNLDKPSNH